MDGSDTRRLLRADAAGRDVANNGTSFSRDEHFVLFELDVASAFSTEFGSDGQPVRQRWRAARAAG
jgi:hypothetical protein